MLTPPTKAPTFTLTNDADQPVSLTDFAGKRVLLFFFPKAGTSGCTTQACGFRDAFPKIEEAGAVVIGISPDAPKALAKWRAKEHLPYVLLSDPDHKVADSYGAWGERSMYGKKFMGIIRSHFVIDGQGNLEASAVKVSPKDSIEKGVASLLATS
ncbi:MAG: thioredoxin-dependent thiol peroxidase [Chloroflexota bacterium]